MSKINNKAKNILDYCQRVLSNQENYNYSKFFNEKSYSERCIETPWVASLIEKYKPKSILDIGFSMSSLDYLGLLLEIKYMYQIRLEAIDIIKPERVKTRYPKEWLERILSIPIFIGDIRKIELNKKYSVITCISTIEHIGFDEASINNPNSAFNREINPKDVNLYRDPNVNIDVLNKFHSLLENSGLLIISVPAGKGGPILLKDSLNYFTAEWEYEQESWNEIIKHPKFKLLEQHFFKLTDNGYWCKVDSINDLDKQVSSLKEYAQGCALALLKKIN